MIPNHTRPITAQTIMRLHDVCATPRMMMYVGAILMKLPRDAAAFVLDSCCFTCNPRNPAYARKQCICVLSEPRWWAIIVPDDSDLLACMQQLPELIASAFEQHINPFAVNEVILRRARKRAASWGFGRLPDAKEGR